MENAFGILILYLFVILEFIIMRINTKTPPPWKDMVLNLNSGHILMWFGRGFEVVIFGFVLNHFSIGFIQTWNPVLQWIFVFFAWDFCFYWLHRAHHAFPALWSVHEVHHQGEHFNLSLGIRNSWFSSLTSIPFFLILAWLGASIEQFVVVGSIHYFMQFLNHNHLVKNMGWFEKILVTPNHHKVHHGCNDEYLDKNCSGTLIIWDKMFGTFQKELPEVPVKIGLSKPINSQNPFWINLLPIFAWLGIKKLITDTKKQPDFGFEDWVIGAGGLLLFGWLIFYINIEGQWDLSMQVLLFISIFSGTLSIAGISEGKKWGLYGWNFLFLLGIIILYNLQDATLPEMALISMSFLYTFYLMATYLKQMTSHQLNA